MWTPVDVTRLLAQIKKKKSIEDISKQERRSVQSIKAKLKDIAVDLYFNKNIKYEKVEEITGIQKDALVVRRTRVEIPERSGSPKNDKEVTDLAVEAVAVAAVPKAIEPETIKSGYQLTLSTENPFSISSLSALIHSTIDICLLPRDN
jgi:tRNA U54 and U55 pseudouridine synthase Pus10